MHAVEVLLIEDNAGDAVLIRQVLGQCSVPINLHIACDGAQALLILTNPYFKPDLIILDLNIPKITGLALLERWQVGKTPVVVFSSSMNEVEKRRVLTLGAREFIAKPTDLDEYRDVVYGIVEKWIVPRATQQPAVL
jgi:CheY-like chemotaxis protein